LEFLIAFDVAAMLISSVENPVWQFVYTENQSEVDYKLRYDITKLMLFLTYVYFMFRCRETRVFSLHTLCSDAVKRAYDYFMSSWYASDVNEKVTHAWVLRLNFDLLRKLEIIWWRRYHSLVWHIILQRSIHSVYTLYDAIRVYAHAVSWTFCGSCSQRPI